MATDVAVDRDAEKLGDNAHSCMDRLSRNMAINEISSKVHMMQTSLSFLHTEVNNDREFLHLRLEELEHRLAAMERWKPVALPAAAAVDSKPRDPCDIDVDEDLDVLEYSLGSTLWDAPAFMGLPELGGGSASVIFFLAAVMNVVVQLFLTYQLLWSGAFITPDLFKDELSAARRWRLFEAHEYSRVDGSGVSLASRVCQGDQALSVASAQTSMLGQINSYLGLGQRDFEHSYLMSDGPILCLICITIFVVVIMKELRSLTMDVLAVLSVPRGRTRIEDGRLVALSMFRLLNMLFVDLGRLVVAVALLVTGTMWLAFTPDITDLILNAAALCFVMDLDEVLFEAAVPAVVQRYVANMAPLRYKRPRFHLEAILPLVLMAIVVTTSAVLFVMPNAEDMTNVKKALCRGQIDFSVHQNGAGYIVSSETTNFFEDIDMNGLKPLAVQELRDLPSMHGIVDPRWSLLALTREMYARERQMTVEDLAVQTYCADMDTFNDGVAIEESPVWFLTIRDAVPHERGRPMCRKAGGPQDCLPFTCPAAAYLCHNVSMMRTLCPVTCGIRDSVPQHHRHFSTQSLGASSIAFCAMAKHEVETMLKIEAEALSSGRAAPQTHAGCAGLRRCLVRGCAVFSAALCAAPALYRALCRAESTRVPAHEISQELSERHHMTDFGLAPHTLHLSGFDCRGHNSHVDYANGEYSFGGVTGEGRAFFVQDPDRFQQNSETRILYYDRECDGKHGGGNNMYGAWKLAYDTKEHFDFERSEMMRVDGECWGFAEVVVDTGVHGKPWYFDAEPGPAPPTKAHWQVWCGDTVKHKVQAITVHFREAANIHGEWQFLYSAMPDEKVTMKHGKKETTSNNRKWDTQGKDSIDVGGDVSFSYELFFGASVQGKTSREVSSSLASSWSHETEYSTEVVREFKLPKDSGSAFYQWVLTATTPDQEAMDVLTQSFAFTPDAAHPPRCYPGGSTDGYRYQKCNPGWQLS